MSRAKTIVTGFTTDPNKFLELGEKARAQGFKNIDCTMPYPVHGFEEAYGFKGSWIGLAALGGLFTGWVGGFSMQAWMMSVDYPVNIGGRPPINWPAFIPVTFECGILVAGLTTLVCLLLAGQLKPNPCMKVMREDLTHDLFSIIIPIKNDEEKAKAENFLKDEQVDDIDTFDASILTINQCCSPKVEA